MMDDVIIPQLISAGFAGAVCFWFMFVETPARRKSEEKTLETIERNTAAINTLSLSVATCPRKIKN